MGLVRLPLIAICLLALPAQAQYSGGSGTAEDPYRIATAADLIALGETPDDYDKHFIRTADIDLDPNLPGRGVFDNAVIAPVARSDGNRQRIWRPGSGFTGVFDGGGHVISRLTIRGQDYLGLFSALGGGAKVVNLGLRAVDIKGTGGRIGALAGGCAGNPMPGCRVIATYSTGVVRGKRAVGGLAGSFFPDTAAVLGLLPSDLGMQPSDVVENMRTWKHTGFTGTSRYSCRPATRLASNGWSNTSPAVHSVCRG